MNGTGTSPPLKLRAEDREDLEVIAACLQDALVHVGEMTYLPRRRRFAAACNRFVWEDAVGEGTQPRRRRCGVHFDGVLAAKTQGLQQDNSEQLLELLTIACEEGEEGAATVTLIFAGGASVRLELECIDCTLIDMGAPWRATRTPAHGTEDSE